MPGRLLPALRAWRFGHAQAALASLGVLWRAPLGTVLTATVIGVALAVPAGALVAVGNLMDVSTHFGASADISVFLHTEVGDEEGAGLASLVAGLDGVTGVRVVTKSQALEEFRAAAQFGYGLEAMGETNPLPVVLVVTPRDADGPGLAALVQRLEELPGVDFVQDDRDWIGRLEALAEVARRALWLVAGVLSVGIVLVVGNTVRLSVESRRAEVEIAKLFGASDAFVRRPFLYHGVYYGLAGALVASLLLVAAGLVLDPALERLGSVYGGGLPIHKPGATLFLGLAATGALLGLIGAWIWVGWHLRQVEPH